MPKARHVYLCYFDKVIKPNPTDPDACWDWNGATNKGYAKIKYRGKMEQASRISYMYHKGPPQGLFVLHTCDNPRCTNPRHLRLGKPKDNTQDAKSKGRLAKGSRHGNSKLTESQVVEIKANPHLPRSYFAEKFGVGVGAITEIRSGRNWVHV